MSSAYESNTNLTPKPSKPDYVVCGVLLYVYYCGTLRYFLIHSFIYTSLCQPRVTVTSCFVYNCR